MANKTELITNKDRDLNAIKAGLKLLPGGIGESLIQLFWGAWEESQKRRLQETVKEVEDKVNERNLTSKIDGNEDFATFFSEAAQPISRSTNEDKRQRFRDLLFNSMFIPQGDPAWEESMHCLELLQKVDAVGLYTLATIDRADRDECRLGVLKQRDTRPRWLRVPKSKMATVPVPIYEVGIADDFLYDDVLVTKSIDRLRDDLKLVSEENQPVWLSTHAATSMNFVSLTREGHLLVKWTIAPF